MWYIKQLYNSDISTYLTGVVNDSECFRRVIKNGKQATPGKRSGLFVFL